MKRLFVISMIGAMAVSMAACGVFKNSNQKNQVEVTTEANNKDQQLDGGDPSSWAPDSKNDNTDGEIVQIPSDFIEVDSLDAAKDIAGFSMTAPEVMDGYETKNISVINLEDKMIQVIFSQDEKEVVIRKEAIGKDGVKDISGDYTEYVEKNEINIGSHKVSASGNEGKIYMATWCDKSYNYSVGSTDGFSQEELKDLVSKVQ